MLKKVYLTPTEKKVIQAKCERTGEDYEKRIKVIEDYLNKKKAKRIKRKKRRSNNLVYDHVKKMYEAL